MIEDLKKNLTGLIAVAVFAWIAGNVQGTSQNANNSRQIEEALRRIEAIEKTQDGRRAFINNAVTRIEYVCSRDPECRDRFRPMEVPE